MKRYYSHYTFIYPDIYLKNHIVELDEQNKIVNCFPFEKEIEKTEFYSGLLMFIERERGLPLTSLIEFKNKMFDTRLYNNETFVFEDSISYDIYNEEGILLGF